MSDYIPKVGDKVKVVLVGAVTYADKWAFALAGADINFSASSIVSVEKVEPELPTTIGSVIQADVAKLGERVTLTLGGPGAVPAWCESRDLTKSHPTKGLSNIEILYAAIAA